MKQEQNFVLTQEERKRITLLKERMRYAPAAAYPIRQLMKDTQLNRTKLYRGFHLLYGVSITVYLLERRLMLAKKILRTTQLPVKAVAKSCGFTNDKYFFRFFKQRVLLTPTEYRTRYSKTKSN